MTMTIDRITLLVLLAGSASGAHAQTLTWLNAAGGAAATAANWNPAQIPSPANTLLFSLNATYPVSFSSGTSTSSAMTFVRGNTTFTMTSTHTTGAVILGNTNASTAVNTLTTGTWNSGAISIGTVLGSAGTLNVNDQDAVLTCGTLHVAADTNQTCNLNITGSGRVNSGSATLGLNNPSGVGRATVSGQSQIFPVRRSTWAITGGLTVGNLGIGTLNVAAGGVVTTTGDLTVALRTSPGPTPSQGVVTVGGLGLILPASIQVGGNIRIGRGTSAASDTGIGSMFVNDDGVVTATGSAIIGGSGAGSGSLAVNTGGRFTSAGLSFGSSGSLSHTGGVITVNGGTFVGPNPAQLIVSGASDTELVLDGATSTFTAPNVTTLAAIVGDLTTGKLSLLNGASFTAGVGGLSIGNREGSSGSVLVGSGSQLQVDSDIIIGPGSGSLTISGGSIADNLGLVILNQGATSAGSATVSGSTLECSAISCRPVNGGTATLSLTNGGVISLRGNFGIQCHIGPSSTLNIDSGTLDCLTDVRIEGAFVMSNGTVNCRNFFVNAPSSASGVIRGKLSRNTPATLTATGPLTLGDGSSPAFSFVNLAVGTHTVTILDSDTADLGTTSLNGGTLSAANGHYLPAEQTLSGTGTIIGDVSHNGLIAASGTNGLTFVGQLSGVGVGITGTKVRFASGGSFVGTGTIAAQVEVASGGSFVCTGTTRLSNNAPGGFTSAGLLDAAGVFIVSAQTGFTLTGNSIFRSAFVESNSTIVNAGTLRGSGSFHNNVVSSGIISPGDPAADRTQSFRVAAGTFSMSSGNSVGTFNCEIEGPAAGQADSISVQGACIIAGRLSLMILDNFVPVNGFSRTIIRSDTSLSGSFSEIDLPDRWHIERSATAIDAVYCSADFNSDGFVDGFDYDDFVACFEGAACPGSETADFNRDGFSDGFDYDDFIIAFEEGC